MSLAGRRPWRSRAGDFVRTPPGTLPRRQEHRRRPLRLPLASTASPPARPPTSRRGTPTSGRCASSNGWDFDAVKLGTVTDGSGAPRRPPSRRSVDRDRARVADLAVSPRAVRGLPADLRDEAPQRHPRLGSTPARPSRPTPTRTRTRSTGSSPGRASWSSTASGRTSRAGSARADPARDGAPDHEHRDRASSTTCSSSCSCRSTRDRELQRDRLRTVVLPDRAAHGAGRRDARGRAAPVDPRRRSDRARVIFAAAASQAEMLDALAREPTASTGRASRRSTSTSTSACPLGDPRSFGRWLDEHIWSRVRPGTRRAASTAAIRDPARRVAPLRRAPRRRRHRSRRSSGSARTATSPSTTRTSPTSTTRETVKPVEIDDTSRHQQVRDGAFRGVRGRSAPGAHRDDVGDPRQPRAVRRRARSAEGRGRRAGRWTARSRRPARPRRCGGTPMPCCSSTSRRSR